MRCEHFGARAAAVSVEACAQLYTTSQLIPQSSLSLPPTTARLPAPPIPGNILLDDDGRIVHIDFGFLLSNSPGGVNFEAAPFKLTRELLEVMDSNSDGRPSEMFDYFKVLMIQVRTRTWGPDPCAAVAKLMFRFHCRLFSRLPVRATVAHTVRGAAKCQRLAPAPCSRIGYSRGGGGRGFAPYPCPVSYGMPRLPVTRRASWPSASTPTGWCCWCE